MSKIDDTIILTRLELLYNDIKNKKEGWQNVENFAFLYGKSDEDQPYRKGAAFHRWLLNGYEVPESLLFISTTNKTFTFIVPTKLKQLLSPLEKTPENYPLTVKIIDVNPKDKNDQKSKINLVLTSVSDGEKIGLIVKDKHEGEFVETWRSMVEKFSTVDVTTMISELLIIKDDNELKAVKRSALITSTVMQKKFIPRMETIIDEEIKITHSALSDEMENIILDAKKNISDKLNSALCDRCYSPIIQSGGVYDLRPNAISNDEQLHFGTIICSLGVRYRSYCTNVSRTFLIDPKKEQEINYEALLDVHKTCLKEMIPGNPCSNIYTSAHQLISSKYPSLLPYFVKSVGFGMGIEFRESSLILNDKNSKTMEVGMVFNLSIGFSSIPLSSAVKDKKRKVYSLLVADTVAITSNGAEVITKCEMNYSDISFFLEEEAEIKVTKPDSRVIEEIAQSKVKNSERNDHIQKMKEEEEKRKKHQSELYNKQMQERKKLYSEMNNNNNKKENFSTQKDIQSYPSVADFNPDFANRLHSIIVDDTNESVLLPIYGTLVPFHISTIKNVNKDNDVLRINFIYPGTQANMPLLNHQALKDAEKVFIREFLFRIPVPQHLNATITQIKQLQKVTRQQEQYSDTLRSLKKQEKLILSKNPKNPSLHGVYIRPSIGKRTVGTVEAHKNGIRFTPSRSANPIDILYKNVRHAFFQPADKDLLVAIHFRLYDAIMVGNKKAFDVQFCTEVTDTSQSTTGKKRYHDEDELEDEQREREMKARLEAEYQRFAKHLEDITGGTESPLEFDVPYKELGFYGVPFKSNVFVQPTVNCLIQLIEPPFFVLSLSDVEICCLERVQFNLQLFDAKFILKDYSKPVVPIDNIPVQFLETLKKWLDSCNINYYSLSTSLNWKNVMSTIRDDPKDFFDNGGWRSILGSDSEDEQIDEVEDGDDDYEEENDDYEDDDDDDDDEYDDDDGDDSLENDSGSDASEDDSEEEGDDWDEMEEKLRKADMESKEKRKRKGRDFSDDDEEDDVTPVKKKVKYPPAKPSSKPPPKSSNSKPGARPPPPKTTSKPPAKPLVRRK